MHQIQICQSKTCWMRDLAVICSFMYLSPSHFDLAQPSCPSTSTLPFFLVCMFEKCDYSTFRTVVLVMSAILYLQCVRSRVVDVLMMHKFWFSMSKLPRCTTGRCLYIPPNCVERLTPVVCDNDLLFGIKQKLFGRVICLQSTNIIMPSLSSLVTDLL